MGRVIDGGVGRRSWSLTLCWDLDMELGMTGMESGFCLRCLL